MNGRMWTFWLLPVLLSGAVGSVAHGSEDEREGAPARHLKANLDRLVSGLLVCPPTRVRFVDNGDGTICDGDTGLMWEKKNGADGVPDRANPHDVDNVYAWADTSDNSSLEPDGEVFTDFLARLNGAVGQRVESRELGGYHDWRLPTLAELQTLHPAECSASPCVIDPIFLPTAEFLYWTQTSLPRDFVGPVYAWGVFFNTIGAVNIDKSLQMHVRAVRGPGWRARLTAAAPGA